MALPTTTHAQQLQAVAVTSLRASGPIPGGLRLAAQPSRRPYILTGAVAGGAIAGLLAYNDVRNSDAILGEVGIAIAAAAGAAAGALVGWAVYELRH